MEQNAKFQNFFIVQHLPVFVIGMIAFDIQRRLKGWHNASEIGVLLSGVGLVGLLGRASLFPIAEDIEMARVLS